MEELQELIKRDSESFYPEMSISLCYNPLTIFLENLRVLVWCKYSEILSRNSKQTMIVDNMVAGAKSEFLWAVNMYGPVPSWGMSILWHYLTSISFNLRNITQQLYRQPWGSSPSLTNQWKIQKVMSLRMQLESYWPSEGNNNCEFRRSAHWCGGHLLPKFLNHINYEWLKATITAEDSMPEVEAGHGHFHTLQCVSVS